MKNITVFLQLNRFHVLSIPESKLTLVTNTETGYQKVTP